MKTDIEIARSVNMRRITDVAEDLGIPEEKVAQYGHYMAKVPLSLIDEDNQEQTHPCNRNHSNQGVG